MPILLPLLHLILLIAQAASFSIGIDSVVSPRTRLEWTRNNNDPTTFGIMIRSLQGDEKIEQVISVQSGGATSGSETVNFESTGQKLVAGISQLSIPDDESPNLLAAGRQITVSGQIDPQADPTSSSTSRRLPSGSTRSRIQVAIITISLPNNNQPQATAPPSESSANVPETTRQPPPDSSSTESSESIESSSTNTPSNAIPTPTTAASSTLTTSVTLTTSSTPSENIPDPTTRAHSVSSTATTVSPPSSSQSTLSPSSFTESQSEATSTTPPPLPSETQGLTIPARRIMSAGYQVAVAIGCAVGVILLCLSVLLCSLRRQRRRRTTMPPSTHVTGLARFKTFSTSMGSVLDIRPLASPMPPTECGSTENASMVGHTGKSSDYHGSALVSTSMKDDEAKQAWVDLESNCGQEALPAYRSSISSLSLQSPVYQP